MHTPTSNKFYNTVYLLLSFYLCVCPSICLSDIRAEWELTYNRYTTSLFWMLHPVSSVLLGPMFIYCLYIRVASINSETETIVRIINEQLH